ncbi:unnamed protein product [Peniophora sp. CBMAI 1063]|nr:unnamed protein product [Peniophora sp. CBMAI 1063]
MSLEHKKRGVKRKREDVQVDLHQKISGKLYHGLQQAKHAAKKAKTFETQKLVKKLKTTKPSGDATDLLNLESQLKELKEADHERLGAIAFFNKLKKDKVLSRHPDFQTAFEAERERASPATTSGLSAQLESRLLSSKALAAEINSTISSLRKIITPPATSADGDGPTENENEDEDGLTESVQRPTKVAKLTKESTPVATRVKPTSVPVTRNNESDEDEGSEEESDELPEAQAEQDVADDGWESGSVDEDGNVVNNHDEDDSESESSDAPAPPTTTASNKSKPSESVFLPSLAVGFTRGDSDSDFSDSEAKVADSVRKNRRGQRARRAIWEKKYGKGAKHLNKGQDGDVPPGHDGSRPRAGERQGPRQRDNGRDSRPARPSQTNAGRPPRRDVVPRHQQPPQPYHSVPQSNGPLPPRRTQKPAEEKPLHPSWEAKKRLKEQQSAGIRPPTGTKITFND